MELFYQFTNRHDGFSNLPYDKLNLALHVNDNPALVSKNRDFINKNFGIKNITFMDQIHGDIVQIIQDKKEFFQCDGIITNQKNLALAVLVADCIPILLYDCKNKIISAIHAGRAGAFLDIVTKTIYKMKQIYNTNPLHVKAFLGPSIKQCCYEINGEILEKSIKNFPLHVKNNHLDIKGIVKMQLKKLNVFYKDIDICTCCNKNYFSYRRDGVCGRNAGIIMLRDLHV